MFDDKSMCRRRTHFVTLFLLPCFPINICVQFRVCYILISCRLIAFDSMLNDGLKASGVELVIAKSFARIFYRNAINIGLLLIECDTDKIDAGDELEIDVKQGFVHNKTKDIKLPFAPLPDVMIKLLNEGGLIQHLKLHGDFDLV